MRRFTNTHFLPTTSSAFRFFGTVLKNKGVFVDPDIEVDKRKIEKIINFARFPVSVFLNKNISQEDKDGMQNVMFGQSEKALCLILDRHSSDLYYHLLPGVKENNNLIRTTGDKYFCNSKYTEGIEAVLLAAYQNVDSSDLHLFRYYWYLYHSYVIFGCLMLFAGLLYDAKTFDAKVTTNQIEQRKLDFERRKKLIEEPQKTLKETLKETPKEPVEEPAKEPAKETPKETLKEPVKKSPKEQISFTFNRSTLVYLSAFLIVLAFYYKSIFFVALAAYNKVFSKKSSLVVDFSDNKKT